MSSEIIQSIIIMMIFNMSTSYFHKNSFHYFLGLFNDKADLRVRWLEPQPIFQDESFTLVTYPINPPTSHSFYSSNYLYKWLPSIGK